MPNLKDIRRRIKSVKNTEKITQAMRMVAAAKVKRAEAKMKAGRPYAETLTQLLQTLDARLKQTPDLVDGAAYASAFKPSSSTVKRVALLVMGSDRGLCGAYNTNVYRAASQRAEALEAEGIEVSPYLVGNRTITAFKNRLSHLAPVGQQSGMTNAPSVQDASLIGETLLKAFIAGEFDSVEVIYTEFKSMVSYQVQRQQILPVHLPEESTASSMQAELLLEPSPAAVLDQLVPLYVKRSIYAMLLESAASELAARMTAMANATDNAKAMISSLTLQYNKARQAAITQEIMEIVGGAEALA